MLVDALKHADNSGNSFDDGNMVAAHLEALGNVRVQSGQVPVCALCSFGCKQHLGQHEADAVSLAVLLSSLFAHHICTCVESSTCLPAIMHPNWTSL